MLGLTSAQWIVRALVALAPSDVPGLGEIAIDPPVALFTAVVVIATALLCGLGPVRQAVSTNLVEAVNETGRATGSLRSRGLRSTLVAAQIGLSIVLLVVSALIVRSFLNLRHLDLGFSPVGVVTMNVSPKDAKPSTSEWFDDLITRLQRIPHVESAGVISLPPLALGVIGQETRGAARRSARHAGCVAREPCVELRGRVARLFQRDEDCARAGPPLRRA